MAAIDSADETTRRFEVTVQKGDKGDKIDVITVEAASEPDANRQAAERDDVHSVMENCTVEYRIGEKGLFDQVTILDENDEEVVVYNWLTVKTEARVQGFNPIFEQFDDAVQIGAGDSWMEPEAVTKRVAEELEDARGIDVRDHDIRVVDVQADDVDVL